MEDLHKLLFGRDLPEWSFHKMVDVNAIAVGQVVPIVLSQYAGGDSYGETRVGEIVRARVVKISAEECMCVLMDPPGAIESGLKKLTQINVSLSSQMALSDLIREPTTPHSAYGYRQYVAVRDSVDYSYSDDGDWEGTQEERERYIKRYEDRHCSDTRGKCTCPECCQTLRKRRSGGC